MAVRQCPHCGQNHPEEAQFCPQTGKRIEAPPPQPAPPQWLYCPNCGSPVQSDWLACAHCGVMLSGAPIPPAAAGAGWAQAYPARQAPRRRAPKALIWAGSLLLAAVLVLSAGCLLLTFALGLNRSHRTARMVPPNTVALISINPSIWQIPALIHYQNLQKGGAVFAAAPDLANALTQVSQSIPETEIDFQRDILPWVGSEVSIVQLSEADLENAAAPVSGVSLAAYRQPGRSSAAGGPPFLLAVAVRSERAAVNFLADLRGQWEDQGIEFTEYEYRGANVSEVLSPASFPLVFTVYNDMLLVSPDWRAVNAVIDTARAGQDDSLYAQDEFQKILKQLPANRLGMVFYDCAGWREDRNLDSGLNGLIASAGLSDVESLGGAFKLVASGLKFDYVIAYDLDTMSSATIERLRQQTTDNALTSALPKDTYIYFSGSDLESAFADMIDRGSLATGAALDAGQMRQSLDDFERQTGVEIQEDLLANMQGEYAVAVIYDPASPYLGDADVPLGLMMVIEVSRPQIVDQSMNDLLRSLQQDSPGSYQLVSDQAGGDEVWYLRDSSSGQTYAGYTIHNGVLVLGLSDSASRVIEARQTALLKANQRFSSALRGLQKDARNYFWIDVAGAADLLSELIPSISRQNDDQNIETYLGDLDSIGFSAGRMDRKGLVRGVIQVVTK